MIVNGSDVSDLYYHLNILVFSLWNDFEKRKNLGAAENSWDFWTIASVCCYVFVQ